MNRIRSILLAGAVGLAAATAALAQQPPIAVEPGAAQRALVTVPAASAAVLSVRSPAFPAGGDIPFENTQYRGNVFPGLAWSRGPAGALSYAVVLQDTDKIMPTGPLVHWLMFNIPASADRLDAGMTAAPAGAAYGRNYKGAAAYAGPHTPPGPKHRYHFQVFALDTVLPAAAGDGYASLTAAMRGHVLASGEVVGLGQVDPAAPKPAG
jgi:para-nitrobenzyl esterase